MGNENKRRTKDRASSFGKLGLRRVGILAFATAAIAIGGVPVHATGSVSNTAIAMPSVIGESYTKAQALSDVQTVVSQYTITEFCGHDSWSVRKGYELSRRRFLDFNIVSRSQFRDMRLSAIKAAEAYLDLSGPEEFKDWCATRSVEAAQFFLGLMSGDMKNFEAKLH